MSCAGPAKPTPDPLHREQSPGISRSRPLCCAVPLQSCRKSVLSLFAAAGEPGLHHTHTASSCMPPPAWSPVCSAYLCPQLGPLWQQRCDWWVRAIIWCADRHRCTTQCAPSGQGLALRCSPAASYTLLLPVSLSTSCLLLPCRLLHACSQFCRACFMLHRHYVSTSLPTPLPTCLPGANPELQATCYICTRPGSKPAPCMLHNNSTT